MSCKKRETLVLSAYEEEREPVCMVLKVIKGEFR